MVFPPRSNHITAALAAIGQPLGGGKSTPRVAQVWARANVLLLSAPTFVDSLSAVDCDVGHQRRLAMVEGGLGHL